MDIYGFLHNTPTMQSYLIITMQYTLHSIIPLISRLLHDIHHEHVHVHVISGTLNKDFYHLLMLHLFGTTHHPECSCSMGCDNNMLCLCAVDLCHPSYAPCHSNLEPSVKISQLRTCYCTHVGLSECKYSQRSPICIISSTIIICPM